MPWQQSMGARAHGRDPLPHVPSNLSEVSGQEERASATRESRHLSTPRDRESPASIELAVRAQVDDFRGARHRADRVDFSGDEPTAAPVGDGVVNGPEQRRPAGRGHSVGSDGDPRTGRLARAAKSRRRHRFDPRRPLWPRPFRPRTPSLPGSRTQQRLHGLPTEEPQRRRSRMQLRELLESISSDPQRFLPE